MKLYIYRLEGCKACIRRQPLHNKLALMMKDIGIDVVGVRFGMVGNERIEPLLDHDRLCRKDDDPLKYQAPVYIIECDNNVVKLPDLSNFNTIDEYVDEVINIINNLPPPSLDEKDS